MQAQRQREGTIEQTSRPTKRGPLPILTATMVPHTRLRKRVRGYGGTGCSFFETRRQERSNLQKPSHHLGETRIVCPPCALFLFLNKKRSCAAAAECGRTALAVPSFFHGLLFLPLFSLSFFVPVASCVSQLDRRTAPSPDDSHSFLVEMRAGITLLLHCRLLLPLPSISSSFFHHRRVPLGQSARGKQHEPAFPFCMLASNVAFISLFDLCLLSCLVSLPLVRAFKPQHSHFRGAPIGGRHWTKTRKEQPRSQGRKWQVPIITIGKRYEQLAQGAAERQR
jgi:hypothetical protein